MNSEEKDELKRLATLYMYGILDTDFEPRFDRLTRIAAAIFGTPVSLVSLIDADRQWFKSAHGISIRQTRRDISFCAHAIKTPDVFVVGDAKTDSRFAANPLVTGQPHIRFYAGAPLIGSSGDALGTLCIIDTKPRSQFEDSDRRVLQDMADTVIDLFELQVALRKACAAASRAA